MHLSSCWTRPRRSPTPRRTREWSLVLPRCSVAGSPSASAVARAPTALPPWVVPGATAATWSPIRTRHCRSCAALVGDTVRFHSGQHAIDGYVAGPVPPAPVPLWLGSQGPRRLEVTRRSSDAWICPLNIYISDTFVFWPRNRSPGTVEDVRH